MIKGFTAFAVITVNIMWAAWIFAAIWRGYDFHVVYSSVIAVTLCLLCWLMTRLTGKISAEKERYRFFASKTMEERQQVIEFFLEVRTLIDDGKQAGKPAQDILEEVHKKVIGIVNGVIRE